jgi:hypothetical protein
MIGKLERERACSEASPGPIESRRNPIKFYTRLTSLLLAGLVTIAAAQDDGDHENQFPGEPLTCQSLSSASRTREACGEVEQTVLRLEKELSMVLEPAAPKDRQCETRIAVEYFQRDTIARVNGVIENETCAASSGQYEIEVRVKNENGEIQTLEVGESWQRDDDQPVEFTADYPIGENVELITLRSRGLRCICAGAIEE